MYGSGSSGWETPPTPTAGTTPPTGKAPGAMPAAGRKGGPPPGPAKEKAEAPGDVAPGDCADWESARGTNSGAAALRDRPLEDLSIPSSLAPAAAPPAATPVPTWASPPDAPAGPDSLASVSPGGGPAVWGVVAFGPDESVTVAGEGPSGCAPAAEGACSCGVEAEGGVSMGEDLRSPDEDPACAGAAGPGAGLGPAPGAAASELPPDAVPAGPWGADGAAWAPTAGVVSETPGWGCAESGRGEGESPSEPAEEAMVGREITGTTRAAGGRETRG